jgi:urea transporter
MSATAEAPASTATVFGRPVLPPTAEGQAPFWRVVLRGCSQCCFQTNEVTGVLFLVAVLVYSWEQSLLMLMGATIGAGVAKLLKPNVFLYELGLYGFNSCLMALAVGNFFAKDAAMWLWAAALCVVCTLVAWGGMRWLRFPVLAAPFIVTFWAFWPFAEDVGLTKLQFPPFIDSEVHSVSAAISALGAALFAGTVAAGIVFFIGVMVSNWKHAVLAVSAALIAHTVAVWWDVPGEEINSGLAGFNAVLAAVAIYALCTADIRLALFGAIVASAVLPLFGKLDLISLAAGFVLTTWLVLALAWVQVRWFDEQPALAPAD